MKRVALLRKVPMPRTPKPATGKPKPLKCKNKACRKPFEQDKKQPYRTWCSLDCGVALALDVIAKKKAKAQRQERAADKVKREALKTRADWMAEAQKELNAWIRLVRDSGKPCISCGRHHQGQNHAGHFISRGARPNLALVEMNIHLQCQPCNVHLSGNQINYRLGLIARYNVELVESLEADQEPRKYTIEQLKEIRDHYRRLLREHKKENA